MSVGDYNMDVSKVDIRRFFKAHIGGILTQVVKEPTRVSTRVIKGKCNISKTKIDLVFLGEGAKQKLFQSDCINKKSPSDHYMVEFCLDIRVPLKYAVKEYHLDTTRRPLIPKGKLELVRSEIKHVLDQNEEKMSRLPQSRHLDFIWEIVKSVLDKYNPLNKNGVLKKRIYRFTLSKELRTLQTRVRNAKNKLRVAIRKRYDSDTTLSLKRRYKKLRNEKNVLVRQHRNVQQAEKLYSGIKSNCNVWEIIKKFLPNPHFSPPKRELEIQGKRKKELANHMANFFLERAHLVDEQEAIKFQDHIPVPKREWLEEIDMDDSILYDVRQLFTSRKQPTLAAGPDTVSHRHIMDLLPAIENEIQNAINKPLDHFTDISTSYTRLLSKEKGDTGKPFTEKSQRPISELNVLPKYCSVKIFIDQLRSTLLDRLNKNQYAFPGRGGPMGTVKILDDAATLASSGKKVLIVLWDFSNAFCTTIHRITVKIAKKYNLSDRMITLLKEFLEQSTAIIKVADNGGYYLSDPSTTNRGGPQGQIGSDFIFSLVNDGINPEHVFDEIILRTKYVDDFTDIYAHDTVSGVFRSLKHNEALLMKHATSTGLKLNLDKLKIIPLNIKFDELDPTYFTRGPGGKSVYTNNAAFLGYSVEIENCCIDVDDQKSTYDSRDIFDNIITPNPISLRKSKANRNSKISGRPAATNFISRLYKAVRTIITLRKFESNIKRKLAAATQLLWSISYDIGLIFAYCGNDSTIWKQVCVSIRRLIKSAGLDMCTHNSDVYKISTKIDPASMAKKQILQLGIKFVTIDELESSRLLVARNKGDNDRPFWSCFQTTFNALPHKSRRFIADNLDINDKKKAQKIKAHLKQYYQKICYPDGPPSTKKRDIII